MLKQTRMDLMFEDAVASDDFEGLGAGPARPKFTLIVPSNTAWEKAQLDFSKAYNTLQDSQFPQYVSILDNLVRNYTHHTHHPMHASRAVQCANNISNCPICF
jgi:hypothetical protein